MVRTLCFHHCSPGSVPGLGTKISHHAEASHCPRKKTQTEGGGALTTSGKGVGRQSFGGGGDAQPGPL